MAGAHDQAWVRLGKGDLPTEDQDVGLGHIVSVFTYDIVFTMLLLLTGITVWAAFQNFGVFNLFIALAIATAKATIVTFFFMHLNWENKIFWGIVIYPLFIFVLILLGTLGDLSVTRTTVPMSVKASETIEPLHSLNKNSAHHEQADRIAH